MRERPGRDRPPDLGARCIALDRRATRREWLGWLDAPTRELDAASTMLLAEVASLPEHDAVVLLGMGGSSLAPEVFRRAFDASAFHVLDTTHPRAVRRLAESLEPGRTLFLVSSKSGGDARDAVPLRLLLRSGRQGRSPLRRHHRSRVAARSRSPRSAGFAATLFGVPSIGGRYSALSPFGLVPAALMGADVVRLLGRARSRWSEACRLDEGNPGLALGDRARRGMAGGPRQGLLRRALTASASGSSNFSPSRRGRTARGSFRRRARPRTAPTGRGKRCACRTPTSWARRCSAGSSRRRSPVTCSGSTRSTSPTCRRRRTGRTRRSSGDDDAARSGRARSRSCSRQPGPGDYVAIQAFVDPAREGELAPLVARAPARPAASSRSGSARATCTRPGSCTRAGPTPCSACRSWTTSARRWRIPGRPFGFGRLIRAQAAGDLAALERARPQGRTDQTGGV